MKDIKKEISINIGDAQKLLEIVALLDNRTKELAFATLTGMKLASEANRKTKIEKAG